jgi:hypothetical protein
MKKQLVIIGIVAILVSVVLSGCNGFGTTSIKEILEHPNRYINQTVVIMGKYLDYGTEDGIREGNVTDEQNAFIFIKIPSSVGRPDPFVTTAKYKFTGIVRYGELYKYAREGPYLEVTKIETT